jgi:putative tricarboxylic transport membrane protein
VAKIALHFFHARILCDPVFSGLRAWSRSGGSSLANALISLFIGLLIATVGVDDTYGAHRFTFGVPLLSDGIDYLVVMVGAYGLRRSLSASGAAFHHHAARSGR